MLLEKKTYYYASRFLIIFVVFIYLIPIYWIILTSLKSGSDISAQTPQFFFRITFENYQKLVESQYFSQLRNSIIIGFTSTILAVVIGTLSAYAFSRFKVSGEDDLLFFILSTRMLPPIVIVIPVYLMYTVLGLRDTHFGLILLYTTFNLSFAVWLMKGFIDEIPREYEDAALVDGYTRFQAFRMIVLPQAATGIAATAVFCLITAWNEFAFALVLTEVGGNTITAPPSIVSATGKTGYDWGKVAAGTFIFLVPIAIFTFLVRKHLLRGVTFGAIKK
ncbi:sugar ABC transporter permease [Candidatus Poribacteria bacterium]|nr:sugar ABC transporter permease [Candidatus Poribacteria bacterium]MEE2908960.1 carbohydrate ABC transporter permease [Candidatus Poribacteria bacterium]|tara:strand:+ start:165 stop:995 length:831 start_codon:yes stop_codon:yes gene_type:complete